MTTNKAASPADLRAARQARLANKTAAQPATKPAVESQPAATVPVVETAKPKLPEVLTASVLNPSDISKTAEVSLHLFNEKSSDPHWLVCAGGQPVAQIRLSDQEEPEKLAKVFTTEAYANGIAEASQQMELADILKNVRARSYVAEISGSDAYKAIETQVKADLTQDARKAKSTLRDDFLNTLNLVVSAQTKNYIVENALKDALFRRFAAAGMEEDRVVAAIEAAWQEKGPEYFENTFKAAMKYMDYSPEAYADLCEHIQGMPQRTPTVEVEASARQNHNVPLMTITGSASEGGNEGGDPELDRMRATLGFGSRRVINYVR